MPDCSGSSQNTLHITVGLIRDCHRKLLLMHIEKPSRDCLLKRRPTTARTIAMALALSASAGFLSPAFGQVTQTALDQPISSRWQSSLAAFAAADREKPPASDGVLFVGSSTIRLWTSMARDFRQLPVVINRGFGGSTMAECDHFAKELVNRYKPRHVLVYAGDNDLNEGRSPQQVLDSFASFVKAVRSELPGTRISYISIKPSPSRAVLIPRVREANQLLASYVATVPNAEYIDTFTPMMEPDGSPKKSLFGIDMLHLNDAGYALWQSVIASHIAAAPTGAAPENTTTSKAAVQSGQASATSR